MAVMLPLTRASAASTLLNDKDICRELAFTTARPASTLEEEPESESEEALFVEIDAFTEFSEASTLDDEVKRLFELALIVESVASMLEDDDERLREEA